MEINQLIQFKKVAEYENMTTAAYNLFISQPALSQTIKRFENELGVELFTRSGKKIKLNERGKLVLTQVDKILEEIERLSHIALEAKLPLKIGSVSRFYKISLSEAMRSTYPNHFSVIIGSDEHMKAKLDDAELDIAITSLQLKGRAYISFPYGEDRYYACLPKNDPLCTRRIISFNDLQNRSVLRIQNIWNSFYNNLFVTMSTERRLNINFVYVDDYLEYLSYAAESDDFILLAPGHEIRMNTLSFDKYVIVPIDESILRHTYYFSYRKDNFEQVKSFIEWLNKNYTNIYQSRARS